MRTTLAIEDDILQALEARAAETGRPLTHVVNDTLRAGLDVRAESPRRRRYREEAADLGVPRVNLDHALAVAAELEDEETFSARGERVFGAE